MKRQSACGILLAAAVLLPVRTPARSSGQGDGHAAPVESAIVGVEVLSTTKDGVAQQMRRGNGLILRCDGFILVPSSLFARTVSIAGQMEPAAEQRIMVIAHPGTPREKRYAGRNPRFTPREVGYAVIKLTDFHSACAITTYPEGLKPGANVSLAFSRYDFASRRFLPVERRPAVIGEAPAESEKGSEAVEPLQGALTGVPPGAIAVGRSGMPIGLCTEAGANGPSAFTSTEALHLATNCVTPRPEGKPDERDLVAVQGGQVSMPASVIAQQPDMEGSLGACMPPFQIDQFEVTNEQYLAYWETLPESSKRSLGFRSNYYPWTWAPWPANPPFPSEIAKYPVLGVPVTGARGFARSKGKRLPTPYEWYLAAMGPHGQVRPPDWIGRYITEKKQLWERAALLHAEQMQLRRELQQDGVFLQGPLRLPWIANTGLFTEPSNWSRQVIVTTFGRFFQSWKEPLYVREVGSREYDHGPSGMLDALLNAWEMPAPYPGPPGLGNPRYFELQWQPPKPPTPQEPWMQMQIQAMTDDRPLQPLSRLYRRLLNGPSLEDLHLWSNINEMVQIMTPHAGWALAYTADFKASATMSPPDRTPYARVARPAGFQPWQAFPPFTKREMGREAPLQGPGERGGPGPQLHYFLPVGFRCAR